MIIAEHKIETTAVKENIWKLYQDVNSWSKWDEDIIYAKLISDKFENGAIGELKPKGGPKVNLIFKDVVKNKSFTTISNLPLAKLIFIHNIDNVGNKTLITHIVKIEGLLKKFLAFVMGKQIKKNLPFAMEKLIKISKG